tara:strand:- start:21 stop:527 length:507 start_codon:yes stop_codon:yes gene_type:complete
MDDNYIYFELNNHKVKINKEDSEDFWIWYCESGGRKMKNPYWRKPILKEDYGYFRIKINKKLFRLNRLAYYAHNQDWDIHHEPRKNLIDHDDGNTYNNHISNLRVGDSSLNQQNRKNVKGYTWHKRDKRYQAAICINGKQIHLGYYKIEEDARNAYLDGKRKYHKWNI